MYQFAVVALLGLAVLKIADLLEDYVPALAKFNSLLTFVLAVGAAVALDFSMFKNFTLTEQLKVQFRGEAFNAFNTPFFGQPNNLGFISPNSVTPDAPRVGEIRNLRASMRVLQFGLKISF